MGRFLLSALLYIINVNNVPVATFDTFRGMTRWVHDYRVTHQYDPGLTWGNLNVYKCTTHDLFGQKCLEYNVIRSS